MKSYKFLIVMFACFGMLIVSSCKKSFFTDVNTNPNSPSEVTPGSLLATVEGSLAYTQGGDLSRFASMFTQQTIGVARQAQGYYSYVITTQDLDVVWGNFYTQDLQNNYLLIQQSDEGGYKQYAGIGRLLMAYTMQVIVDSWGDVPFTEAWKGVENFHPAYDDDLNLYATISQFIDDGIANLNDPSPGSLLPAADDVIYGGDVSKWIKFGHALKARLAIHQSGSDAGKAQEALDEIALAFTGNEDNAQYFFGNTSTSASPWYQFNTQRGDISFASATLATTLLALSDPRYTIFIDEANDADGLGLAPYYGGISAPVELITYDEIKFIEAEAILRSTGNISDAQASYQDAITANMQKLGVADGDITTYVANNGTLTGSADEAIAQVAVQVNIALYLNPEAWVTYRRTGSPELIAVDGTAVPRRLMYPQTEYTYNAENVETSTLYNPLIFWDN